MSDTLALGGILGGAATSAFLALNGAAALTVVAPMLLGGMTAWWLGD
jgi:hypothetical protein